MDEVAGLHCPRCGHLAVFLIGEQQAFCGNDDCSILMWDPSKTVAQNEADMHEIDLRGHVDG